MSVVEGRDGWRTVSVVETCCRSRRPQYETEQTRIHLVDGVGTPPPGKCGPVLGRHLGVSFDHHLWRTLHWSVPAWFTSVTEDAGCQWGIDHGSCSLQAVLISAHSRGRTHFEISINIGDIDLWLLRRRRRSVGDCSWRRRHRWDISRSLRSNLNVHLCNLDLGRSTLRVGIHDNEC